MRAPNIWICINEIRFKRILRLNLNIDTKVQVNILMLKVDHER